MNEIWVVVLFVTALVAGFILWVKVASRGPLPVPPPHVPVDPMTSEQIDSIETALDVKLPQALRDFLGRTREENDPDEVMVLPWPEAIIGFTLDFRKGFVEEMMPWPARFVYLGDQADACAYALDCESGEILHTHKGYLENKLLERYASFEDWLAASRKDFDQP